MQILDSKLVKQSNVRAIICGNVIELFQYEYPFFWNFSPKKNRTAEAVKREERRADNLGVARTKIRRYIDCNKEAYGQVLKFVTYTFAENVTDLKQANVLWNDYVQRLNYRMGKLKYLCVVEFQNRGAVHYHVLYFNMPYVYGLQDELASVWKHGFVKVKAISHVQNVGAYVCKYLQKEIMDKRLIGQKAFFCSKGLLKPIEIKNYIQVADELKRYIIRKDLETEYQSSKYGTVNYKRGIITHHNHDSNYTRSYPTQSRKEVV